VTSEPTDQVFVKRRTDAPPGFFAWKAAGLSWLGEAAEAGGAAVVGVREVGERHITLDRIEPARPTASAAEALGRALAITHAVGAAAFGAGPPGWHGDGFIGRQGLRIKEFRRWGEFYATTRLLTYATAAERQGTLSPAGARLVDRVCDRLVAGEFDDDRTPARIHGDLWGGNVLYSPGPSATCAAVLIDPAAHGGHGQTDLAMLELFGTPHLERVQNAYAEAAELPADWRERTGLHQLHPLLVHAVTHGPSYGQEAAAVARRYA
jgi:fructosamine-3-kinase